MSKKKSRPTVQAHPRVIAPWPTVTQWPTCEASLVSPEAVHWRLRNEKTDRVQRLIDRGLETLQCGNLATYTIDGHWLCRKHAGIILLDLMAEPVEVGG